MTGTSDVGRGPLDGVRALELGGMGPGPYAGMMLADMGAEVVRIDRPDQPPGGSPIMRRGKRSVMVDLRHPDGVATVLELVGRADLVIEGFRPGVAERLGLGPEQCWQRRPELVYGRVTGWGQDGPLAQQAGHDINYIAVTGALHAIGRAGDPPTIPVCMVGDLAGGGMNLVVGLLAALLEARSSGHGQVVDAAIVDGAAALMTPVYGRLADGAWEDARGVNSLDSGRPWYDVYQAACGGWIAVGAIEDAFYAQFLTGLGVAAAAPSREDPANWTALRTLFTEAFASRTRDEWMSVFDGTDSCVSPVLSLAEAPMHPHARARGVFQLVEGSYIPAASPRFGMAVSSTYSTPPEPGLDTCAVLHDWGVTNIEGLLDWGAVQQASRLRKDR